jgi:hypothetical protein
MHLVVHKSSFKIHVSVHTCDEYTWSKFIIQKSECYITSSASIGADDASDVKLQLRYCSSVLYMLLAKQLSTKKGQCQKKKVNLINNGRGVFIYLLAQKKG